MRPRGIDDIVELKLRPVGWVRVGRTPGASDDPWEESEAEIEVEPALSDALHGVEGFSHVWVLWWLDRADAQTPSLRVHPEKREDLPLVGVFATRSPQRPNPIAMTAVRLLERKQNRLRVRGLDAYQGTPVLDIKPYLPRGDLVLETTIPGWLRQLWGSQDDAAGSSAANVSA